jgi:methyl-accepting chemotaxis protein
MKMSLFGKIIGLIVITAALVGGVVYGTSNIVLNRGLHEQGQSEMIKLAGLVQGFVDDLKDKAAITAIVLAERQDLILAVEKGDKAAVQNLGKGYVKARQVSVLTIADKDGNVVGRGHSDKAGDSVLQQDNVKKSLAGQASSGIEEGTVVKFSLRAGNPIRNGSLVVGSVTTGFDLSSEAFVDEVKSEQAQGIEQVNIAVTETDKVTQQNAATAEETAAASEELSAQAEEMKSYVADLASMVGGNAGMSPGRPRSGMGKRSTR